MTIERRVGPEGNILIAETLNEGPTVADALRDHLGLPRTKGLGPWRKSVPFPDNFPPTPSYHFEEVKIIDSRGCRPLSKTEDRVVEPWVVARGKIEDHLFLMINDQVVLSGPYQQMETSVYKNDNDNLDHLVVKTRNSQGLALHHINRQGEVRTHFAGSKSIEWKSSTKTGFLYKVEDADSHPSMHFILPDGSSQPIQEYLADAQQISIMQTHSADIKSDKPDRVLLAVSDDNQTRFVALNCHSPGEHQTELQFAVPETIDHKQISILSSNGDFSQVLWRVEKPEGGVKVYKNGEQVAAFDKLLEYRVDSQWDRVLLIGKNGAATQIYLGGQLIHDSTLKLNSWWPVKLNSSLTMGVVILWDEKTGQKYLFFITPDGCGLSQPVAEIDNWTKGVFFTNNSIKAKVRVEKDGPWRTWRYPAAVETPQSPQTIEEPVAA